MIKRTTEVDGDLYWISDEEIRREYADEWADSHRWTLAERAKE